MANVDFIKSLDLNPNNDIIKKLVDNYEKHLKSKYPDLYFSRMGGVGILACARCDFSESVLGFIHNLDLWDSTGYQCQKCGQFHKVGNSEDLKQLPFCECGGSLSREEPVFCPQCKSKAVKYDLRYLT